MAKELEPAAQQLEQLAQIPEDQPVAMINLLQFNQPDGVERYEPLRPRGPASPGASRRDCDLRRHFGGIGDR